MDETVPTSDRAGCVSQHGAPQLCIYIHSVKQQSALRNLLLLIARNLKSD